MENITLSVGGMTCTGCAASVKRALENVAGVAEVRVDFANNCAQIAFNPTQTNEAALKQAIENAGFDAE